MLAVSLLLLVSVGIATANPGEAVIQRPLEKNANQSAWNKEKVAIQLKWKHGFQFAGFYAALEKGFYDEAGLDVRIIEGGPGIDFIDAVLLGKAQYGVEMPTLLLRRAQGDPVVVLATIFQYTPMSLMSLAEKKIRTPQDLIGRNIMLRSESDASLRAMISKAGVDLAAINITPHSFDLEDLIQGKTDAMSLYITDTPAEFAKRGLAFNAMAPQDYGVKFYGDSLFTTEDQLTKHPDQVEAFRKTSLKGWEYAMKHPEEIARVILVKYAPNRSIESLLSEAEQMKALLLHEVIEIGHINLQRWKNIKNTFVDQDMLDAEFSLEGFVYEPPLMDKRVVPLTDEERAWIKAHPKVVLGADSDWRPYVIPNKDGSVGGIEADLFQRINALTGLNLQIKLGKWANILEQAKTREIDGLLLSTAQKERAEHFIFSDSPYSTYKYVYSKSSVFRPASMADLAGRKVAYLRGNLFEEKLLRKHESIIPVATDDNEGIIRQLLSGEVDAAISGITLQLYYTERMVNSVETVFIAPDSELKLRYSLRKDWSELVSIINKALAAIPLVERIAILQKWSATGAAKVKASFRELLTKEEKQWLASRPAIKVRVSNAPPFHFMDQGKPAGFSIELINQIATQAGIEVEYVSGMTWSESLEHIRHRDGEVDLLLTAMNTTERREFMVFTGDYLELPLKIFIQRDDDTIKGIDDLIGKTVAIEKGYALVKKIRRSYPGIRLMEIEGDAPETLRAVSLGNADAYIGNLPIANYHIGRLGLVNLQVAANTPFGFHTQAMGVRKDWPELASILDKGMATIPLQEYLALQGKWGLSKLKQSEAPSIRGQLTLEEKAWLAEHPVITLASTSYWPPFVFWDEKGQKQRGFDIDYMELLSRKLGVPLQIKLYPWKEAVQMAKDHQVDALFPAAISEDRKPYLNWSSVYITQPIALMTLRNFPSIEQWDELKGKRVGVTAGSTYIEEIHRLESRAKIVEFKGSLDSLNALIEGKVDAVFDSAPVSYHYMRTNRLVPQIKFQKLYYSSNTGNHRIAVRNDAPLILSIISKGIDAITEDEIYALQRKWMPIVLEKGVTASIRGRLTAEEKAWLDERQAIPMCVDPTRMPFEQINETGEYEGMVADYMAMISRRLGVTFELILTDTFTQSLEKVSAGECRFLSSWAPMPVSGGDDPGLSTRSYLTLQDVLAVRMKAPFISEHDDLAGLRIGAVVDYPTQGKIRKYYPRAKLILVDNVDQGIRKLSNGEIDILAASQTVIGYSIQKQKLSNVKLGGVIPGEEYVRMLVNRNEPLLVTILDKAIASITQDDRQRINNKWFAVTIERGIDYSLIWKISLGFLLVLATVLIWNQIIRRQKAALARNEARLRESEARFRGLSEASFEGIVIHEQGQIIEVNQSALDLFGYERAELVGQHARILMPSESWEMAARHIATADEKPYELQAVCKNGALFPMEVRAKQTPYQGRQVRVTVVRDITERKQYEEALRHAKEEAEKANQAKSIFLANMSHEIRTPMNAVLGFTEILKSLESEPQKAQYLETIHRSGKTLLSLINDILDLSKIEAGKIELQYSPVSVQRLLMEVEMVFGQKADDLGLELQTKVIDPLQYSLLLDETKIRQIVFNLVSNAIKFTNQGSVSITADIIQKDSNSQSRVDLTIAVEDTGIGIAPDQQEKIFKTFEQVAGQKISEFGGTGLGLAICHRITELMNGNLSVTSELGKGSIITLHLPDIEIAATESHLLESTKTFQVESIAFEPATILIVDDIDYNRELLAGFLSPWKFTILFAENGKTALEQTQLHRPDMILMDMKMPVMDGYEATVILKRDTELKKTPIIAITASALIEDEARISQICDGYLRKPISHSDLVDQLIRFLPYTQKAEVPKTQLEETNLKITRDVLQTLPEDWLNDFYSLLIMANRIDCKKLIHLLDKKYSNIAISLDKMINEYRFGELIKLLEIKDK